MGELDPVAPPPEFDLRRVALFGLDQSKAHHADPRPLTRKYSVKGLLFATVEIGFDSAYENAKAITKDMQTLVQKFQIYRRVITKQTLKDMKRLALKIIRKKFGDEFEANKEVEDFLRKYADAGIYCRDKGYRSESVSLIPLLCRILYSIERSETPLALFTNVANAAHDIGKEKREWAAKNDAFAVALEVMNRVLPREDPNELLEPPCDTADSLLEKIASIGFEAGRRGPPHKKPEDNKIREEISVIDPSMHKTHDMIENIIQALERIKGSELDRSHADAIIRSSSPYDVFETVAHVALEIGEESCRVSPAVADALREATENGEHRLHVSIDEHGVSACTPWTGSCPKA